MKNLVCTLETAKKLKEAGWIKETIFIYNYFEYLTLYDKLEDYEKQIFFAPILQEVLDELQWAFKYKNDTTVFLKIFKTSGDYITGYYFGLSPNKNYDSGLVFYG